MTYVPQASTVKPHDDPISKFSSTCGTVCEDSSPTAHRCGTASDQQRQATEPRNRTRRVRKRSLSGSATALLPCLMRRGQARWSAAHAVGPVSLARPTRLLAASCHVYVRCAAQCVAPRQTSRCPCLPWAHWHPAAHVPTHAHWRAHTPMSSYTHTRYIPAGQASHHALHSRNGSGGGGALAPGTAARSRAATPPRRRRALRLEMSPLEMSRAAPHATCPSSW